MPARFRDCLATTIPAESLGFFRLAFGTAMVLASGRMLLNFGGASWHAGFFSEKGNFWTFRYPGLEWLWPVPQPWFSILTLVMALAALCVAAGYFHRASSAVLFAIWTYFHLLERSYHTHVDSLLAVLAFLMIFLPADRALGIGSAPRGERGDGEDDDKSAGSDAPDSARPTIPYWPVFLLRGQLFIVFFVAGLQGLDWLGNELGGAYPLVPRLVIVALGLVFPVLLLTRRTCLTGILGITLLHVFEPIGWIGDLERFPLLAAALLTIFLEPDWPSRLLGLIRARRVPRPDWGWLALGALLLPGIGAAMGWKPVPAPGTAAGAAEPAAVPGRGLSWAAPVLVVLWLGLALALPLRHWLIAGDVNWTREGEFFSWRLLSVRRESLSFRINVADESLLKEGRSERPRVDWERLGTGRRVFRDHDPTKLDWSALPPLLVLYQSNWGDRIVFNPYFGGRTTPLSEDEARQWVRSHWTETYGREPKSVTRTLAPERLFDQMRELFLEKLLPPFVAARLETARPLARRIADASIPLDERSRDRLALSGLLYGFANMPLVGPDVRVMLARVTPFAFDGAPTADVGFLAIEDSDLFKKGTAARHHTLDPERWKGELLDAAPVVHTVIDSWTPEDWLLLPGILAVQNQAGELGLLWNPFQELKTYQIRQLVTSPIASGDYAAHVARVWETRFGTRPEVTIQSRLRIGGGPARVVIDRAADLGDAQPLIFGHREWIIAYPAQSETN